MNIHFCDGANSIIEVIPVPKGITCFVGSGGKTTSIRSLARELSESHRVIVTTTTRMYPPAEMPFCTGSVDAVRDILKESNLVCVGTAAKEGKFAAPSIAFSELSDMADYVLVEADGAKMHPLKLPMTYEPVYPEDVARVICLQGLSGVGKTFREACFRYELADEILHRSADERIRPEDLAHMICEERGILWNAPAGVPVTVVFNQADTGRERAYATEAARRLVGKNIDSVIGVALKYEFGGAYARFC